MSASAWSKWKNKAAGAVTAAAFVVFVIGMWLEYSFAFHHFLGNSVFPNEAMKRVSLMCTGAFTTAAVFMPMSSAFFLAERGQAGGLIANVAIIWCGIGWLARDETFRLGQEPFYATILLLFGAAYLAPTDAKKKVQTNTDENSSKKKEEKEQKEKEHQDHFESAKPIPFSITIPCWVVVLAFLYQTSQQEISCFADLKHHNSDLVVSVTETFTFGMSNSYKLEMDSTSNSFKIMAHSLSENQYIPLFESPPGAAFIVGAREGRLDATNEHEMGLYEFKDEVSHLSTSQEITEVVAETSNTIHVKGKLTFASSGPIPFIFTLTSETPDNLKFKVETSSPVARLYLAQRSDEEEDIFGMGVQYSYSNLKGGCVPVFTQEQGIGRGIQPISYVVNFFVKHSSGSWQTSYAPAPYYMTSKQRALYLANSEFALFDFSSPSRITIEVNASTVSGGFMSGESPLDIIETYTRDHAGRMRRLPDWTGNGAIVGLQGGTELVKRQVSTLQSESVPIAALWLQDWTGKRETGFGRRLQWNWEFSPSHYPGWLDFIREMAEQEIYVLSYINAYLSNTGGISNESITIFNEAKDIDCLIKEADGITVQIQASATPDFTFATVDITNPRCKDWYINNIIRKNMIGSDTTGFDNVNGVLGFMADFSESISLGVKMYAGEGHTQHNDFPVKWAETCREAINMNKFMSENGVFFTRAAGGKSPGQTTLMWMGDQMTTFDHFDGLESALIGTLGAGISGFSLVHSDIGGYTMFQRFGGLVKIARSAELMQRWAEMSVFSDAVFRTHEGVLPDISAQAVSPAVIKHFAVFSRLHKELFPILKKPLMIQAEATGAPIARHLFLQYPKDQQARNTYDQFLVGDSIMVCPILSSRTKGRLCYIPKGEWAAVFPIANEIIPEDSVYCAAPIGRPCVFYLPQAEHIAQKIRDVLEEFTDKKTPSNL